MSKDNITEVWKEIEGLEGIYSISNLERVKSLSRTRNIRPNRLCGVKERILKPFIAKTGYKVYNLRTKENKSKTYLLHRLIGTAFIPNPENNNCINHIDGNKLNNDINNLEWCTKGDNNRHAYYTGLQKTGVNHHQAKFTESQIISVMSMSKTHSRKEIAEYHNIDLRSVYYLIGRHSKPLKYKIK